MVYVAEVQCPHCRWTFRVALPTARRPATGACYDAVCPHNGSRFRFVARAGTWSAWGSYPVADRLRLLTKDVADALGVEAVASRCE
jgi:hypothetical protein